MTFLLTLVLLLPGLILLFSTEPVNGEDTDIILYLHTGAKILTTDATQRNNEILDSMESGESLEYSLEYPFARSIFVTGASQGGAKVFTLHLEGVGVNANNPVLTVDIYMDPVSGSPLKIAGDDFSGDDLPTSPLTTTAVDFQIPLFSDGQQFNKGSSLRISMSLEADGKIQPVTPAITFLYTGTSGTSHISIMGEPIPDDGVDLEIQDTNGNPLEEVIPYGPATAREMNFITSASSAFGANDISLISILVVSSQGSTLLNISSDADEDYPSPVGGEDWTYFNYTFSLPEGTPTDTYTVLTTAESRTGYTVTYESSFEVKPGLFLSMQEDEKEADAGDVITFEMDVLNGGDANDRVTFSAMSQLGWSVDVPEAIEIEGGEEETIEFKVYVPLRAQISNVDEIDLRAESRNAEKTYSITGTITVNAAASYGIEPIGDTVQAMKSGDIRTFQVRVINLLNITKTFEMSTENLPAAWGVTYSSEEGELQGSLFIFEVNGSGEEIVDIIISTSSDGPYGSYQIGSYVRARGESEKKWSYFTLKVVDDSKSVVEIDDDELRKTAGRIGTSYPVKYTKVYYSLELYNPSLDDLDFEMTVEELDGWTIAYDYDEIELGPGAGSLWNISITPEDGSSWKQGAPYIIDVTIDTSTEGEFTKKLEIVLPEVSDVRTEKEWSTVNAVEGSKVPLNITFQNKGNRDETVTITIEAPPELKINLSPMSKEIAPGEKFVARGEVEVLSLEDVNTVSFTIKYSTSKGTTSVDYSMFLEKGSSPDSTSFIPYLIAAAVLVVLAVAGFVGYNMFIGKEKKTEEPKPAKPKPGPNVSVTSAPRPEKKTVEFKSVSSSKDSQVIKEADDILASMLGNEAAKDEPEFEKVEVVEATVVE